MAFDDNNLEDSFAGVFDNVGNDTTTNNANLNVGLDTVGNVDNSTNDSGNFDLGVNDSFNEETNTESWLIDGSFNEESWNIEADFSDNSTNDNSINAGVREYNLGFSGGAMAEAAAAGGAVHGDLWINNQNTVVDQSSSNNIASGGSVFQFSANQAQVASGEGAMAAGDNIDITQSLDRSTNIDAGGDVLIDSEKTVETNIGSGNVTNIDVNIEDNSESWDLDNVGNEYSAVIGIDDSFNDVETDIDAEVWDIDADVVWDSTVITVGDVDLDI
jgi:hypothetical protein